MREISQADIDLLIKNGIIKNTNRGFISLVRREPSGASAHVGFYKTVNGRHRYIEDWYAVKAQGIKKEQKYGKSKRYTKTKY